MSAYEEAMAQVAAETARILGDEPQVVAHMDQAVQWMRDILGHFEVDLRDPIQARAAFAGAFSMYCNLHGLALPPDVGTTCVVEIGTYAHAAALVGGGTGG